jgi:exopolysaccharide/PEP-CTERM locus tyrosine autokinase
LDTYYKALEKAGIEKPITSSMTDGAPQEIDIEEPVEEKKSQHRSKLMQVKTQATQANSAMQQQTARRLPLRAVPSGAAAAYDPNTLNENLIVLSDPRSFEAEQFKMLRSSLLFPHTGKPPRTIMVTSALPGEGKTFVSSNLAVSIAQGINEHVMLIDCDIRLPDLHTNFGFKEVKGLSEYLTARVELKDLLLKTSVDKLTLLPGGTPPPNPAELIASKKMSNLIAEVRSRYKDRFIVIDSPPPSMTSETNVIAKQVDGILLVVNYGKTPREMASQLVELFGKEKILGVVFNRYERGFYSNYRYGKYGYGKKGQYYTK